MNIHATDMTELAKASLLAVLDSHEPDAVLNIESHQFNVILSCDDANYYTLDVGKDLWLNRSRWSRLMREYVPKEALERFIGQAIEILRGEARDGATANMLFRDPDRYSKKHRWGGCLMGATFRAGPGVVNPPTLTFYSRTTYIGYMGFLDMAIASRIVKEIRHRMGETCPTIGFSWHLADMQVHCFKTLPFVFAQPGLLPRLIKYAKRVKKGDTKGIPPTWLNMAKWYNKVLEHFDKWGVKMLDKEKYGPFRRIKRRWCEHQGHLKKNIPPSLLVGDLTFEKCV